MGVESQARCLQPETAVAAGIVLAAFGGFTAFYHDVRLAAVPGPVYFFGSYLGIVFFAIFGAIALRLGSFSENRSQAAWRIAALESFGIAAFLLSTL